MKEEEERKSLLAGLARASGVSTASIVQACGISRALVGRWMNGQRIADKHATALVGLFGRGAVRAIYASFPEVEKSGRKLTPKGRTKLLRRAGAALRGSGKTELAGQVEREAEE